MTDEIRVKRRYILIDWQDGLRGSIYENSYGCWIWWWQPEYGEDENPHVIGSLSYWIECPVLN